MYGGEDLYSVDDNEYKITVGLLHIVDSVFAALHIKPRKLIKVADSFTDFAEPLLHNSGIPSYDAILPIRPFYKEGEQGKKPQKEKKPECNVKKEQKRRSDCRLRYIGSYYTVDSASVGSRCRLCS